MLEEALHWTLVAFELAWIHNIDKDGNLGDKLDWAREAALKTTCLSAPMSPMYIVCMFV